ncbi:uncharacterized protein C3orf85 homolog isoform X1 [Canis lupus dingo]|uniref:uncharacterized protein C3orf85 homolog isoform X1 n=1 Tax=Canis lupus dingo TaxID=286419 RepID=UPI0020C3016E|nr:uncharacterized protein C3orf85 homolog isoform X1 [Canis lupus dingo]
MVPDLEAVYFKLKDMFLFWKARKGRLRLLTAWFEPNGLQPLIEPTLYGALGAPFLSEDPANQFLHLKRHIYLQNYWDPDHNPNMWGNTLADQVHETWTALKTTAEYYLNMNSFTLDVSTAQ